MRGGSKTTRGAGLTVHFGFEAARMIEADVEVAFVELASGSAA
jgi:hypothetical protein